MKMERIFISLRPYADVYNTGKKFCVSCGNVATQEALFNVGGSAVTERYCELCSIIVGGFKPTLI